MRVFPLFQLLLANAVTAQDDSIMEIAESSEDLSTLVDALKKTGLDRSLSRSYGCGWWKHCRDYTVFAPVNDAFAALGPATKLVENEDYMPHLTDLLWYHVLNGEVFSDDLEDGAEVKTLNGEPVTIGTDGSVTINDSNVIDPFDVDAINGAVHTVDSVLLPSTATRTIADIAVNAGFNTLVEALQATDLLPVVSDKSATFTVFAPTDDAFTAAGLDLDDTEKLKKILLYHVVPGVETLRELWHKDSISTVGGGDITVDNNYWRQTVVLNEASQVTSADILALNGIVHVIHKVLVPPGNIVETAQSNSDFSILVEAVVHANLADALSSEDSSLTVFAPTNDAFEPFLAELGVTSITEVDAAVVADILLYHVVGEKLTLHDLDELRKGNIGTLGGVKVSFEKKCHWWNCRYLLDDTTIIQKFDIMATNGVIHVINSVLRPPVRNNIVEVAQANPDYSILVEAVVYAGLADALSSEDSTLTVFAPTNSAFEVFFDQLGITNVTDVDADMIKSILLYHVAGDVIMEDDFETGDIETLLGENIHVEVEADWWSKKIILNTVVGIDLFDIEASNGVIHQVDSVIQPVGHIVEIAARDPRFSILTEAIVYADLVGALSSPDNALTVFAPSDAAFEKLFEVLSVSNIKDIGQEEVQSLLLYHVIGQEIGQDDLEDGEIQTLGDQSIFVKVWKSHKGTNAILNGKTNVVDYDNKASNGLIHEIDSVLKPVGNIVEVAQNYTDFSILVDAVVHAGLAEALSMDETSLTVFAPTNKAFTQFLEANDLSSIEEVDKDELASVLLYHVVGAEIMHKDFENGDLQALNGETIAVTLGFGGFKVWLNKKVGFADFDIPASNGVIHAITSVLSENSEDCVDEEGYMWNGKKRWTCKRVGKNFITKKRRCKKMDKKTGKKVQEHCPKSCGAC